ncbi:MAG: HDOD domain-containing protein [Nitrospirae bacterium]|uniref:HDOD domain-containing protein n=1 Tax=Candidatus Magnetobacterium casense TaxID=1455061 RepID=UPI0005910BCB|nr:HDOD domain-containing protein [Candidatus Magnetobacterium casensis]MBF0338240.1 HDOD domain-containing protein [Nitrospirota bacterium]
MTGKKIPIVVRLLDIINANKDFPAMSRTVALVSKQTSSDSDASVTELTNTILDDFALSNKLLRMVNTAFYIKYHGAGRINTVSRAVYILGFGKIRDAALSLMLFEHIKNKSLALELREAFIISFMSGVVAKEMGKKLGIKDIEEAFICSIFHDLGKLLIRFYLPEEQRKIKELAAAQDITEDEAAPDVIKASYDTVGMEVAKNWNFSDSIVYCMRKIPLYKLVKPTTDMENIRALVLLSSKLCELINKAKPADWEKTLATFKHRFDVCFRSGEKTLADVLEVSYNEIKSYCDNFGFSMDNSHFLQNLGLLLKGPEGLKKDKKLSDAAAKHPMQILDSLLDGEEETSQVLTPDDILTKGILEIANAMLESFSLNDILRMILEVLYRGMECSHIIIGIKTAKEPYMEGRFGFGHDIGKLVKGFRFQIESSSDDVFNISLNKDSIVLINNVYDVEVQSCIPTWLRTTFDVRTFIVIPITLKKVPVAVIYGDWAEVDQKAPQPKRLRYVKTLRNQAMLAIKHYT